MKLLRSVTYQRVPAGRWEGGDLGGAFMAPSCVDGDALCILATSGDGWDHVSVSLRARCPTWAEMDQVKRELFRPHETAMQLHVPPSDHVNVHPFTLHLWRPTSGRKIPRPPLVLV